MEIETINALRGVRVDDGVRFKSYRELDARIRDLETKLEMPHGPPIFNIRKASSYIAILEKQLEQKTPPAIAAAPAFVVPAEIPVVTKVVQSTGDKSLDAAIAKAGCTSLAGLKMRARRDALVERLPSLRGDSLAAAQANIERFNTLLKNL